MFRKSHSSLRPASAPARAVLSAALFMAALVTGTLTAAAGGASVIPAHPAPVVHTAQGATEIEWPGVPA